MPGSDRGSFVTEGNPGEGAGGPVDRRNASRRSRRSVDGDSLRELCHDLIDPAATIKVVAEVTAIEGSSNPETVVRLQQIADEAARIVEICGFFLDRPTLQPVRLDALTASVVSSRRLSYFGGFQVTTEPVTAAVHPVVATRVLNNLLENACRAAGPGGRVRISVERSGPNALLVIADSGGGLGHGPSGKASLGLRIVRSLVRECGGAVTMMSSDLGGAAVAVTLPGPPGRPIDLRPVALTELSRAQPREDVRRDAADL